MRSINLNEFLSAPLHLIAENEFIYFSLPKDAPLSNKTLVKKALDIINAKTSRLHVSVKSANDLQSLLANHQERLPKMIGVELKLGAYKLFDRGSEIQFNDSHLEVIELFKSLSKTLPQNHTLIPEIDFDEEYRQVGPTLTALFEEFELPFAFIKIEGEPTVKKIEHIKKVFQYLQIRGVKNKIYFSFNNPHLQEWNIKSFNTFSGMKMLHIDLSNKCTHSCLFCGVWGPQTIDQVKNENAGQIPLGSVEFMNRQMPVATAIKILEQLPETVDEVQFGGVGDPLTHPEWLTIVKAFRKRGIRVEILTNMEYPNQHQLEELHTYSKTQYGLHLYINISAGNRATYSIIRPRQGHEVYDRVFKNIETLSELKKRDHYGVGMTLLHVINVHNYRDMKQMVELGHQYKTRVWLKPLEVHAEIHRNYEIPLEQKNQYEACLQAAIVRAKELDVELIYDSLNYFKGEQI